jgi:glutaredoxin-like protein NrdH
MTVTVYTKPACNQCTATYRALDKKGIPYVSLDISQDEEALERLKALGFQQAPVVEFGDDSWSGFRPDKIDEIAEAIKAQAELVAVSCCWCTSAV